LPRENPTLKNPNQLEGTLAYISPEQTGRMNRSLDYRTDLYSLGVTFYELLTGQLPFNSDSPMELVHCHIAKTPAPVCSIKPDVPSIISDIVMKLMAKNVEERYQSAFGLQAFERVTEEEKNPTGKGEMMLVAGYSGVGKTALVHEVHKPMTASL